MSWYWIVLIVIGYIIISVITAFGFVKWSKNVDPGWIFVGLMWPAAIISIPFIALIIWLGELIEKYGNSVL